MNDNQKKTIMVIAMIICVMILGTFVAIELGNQAKLISLLESCNYTKICDACISERLYGISGLKVI